LSKRYKTLIIRKKSTKLSINIYELTKKFPKEELYGITDQIRRASVSVSTNIAEGSDLGTLPQYFKHINISKGSLNEVDTIAYLSQKLGYISNEEYDDLNEKVDELEKMLEGFRKYLKTKKDNLDKYKSKKKMG
jgi:four helix bundle protein